MRKWIRFLPDSSNSSHLQILVCKSSSHCHLYGPEEKTTAQTEQATLRGLLKPATQICSSVQEPQASRGPNNGHPASSLPGLIWSVYSTIRKAIPVSLCFVMQSITCVLACLLLSEHCPSGYEARHRCRPTLMTLCFHGGCHLWKQRHHHCKPIRRWW